MLTSLCESVTDLEGRHQVLYVLNMGSRGQFQGEIVGSTLPYKEIPPKPDRFCDQLT